MKKVFSFKKSLAEGLELEEKFKKVFPLKLFKSPTFKHDFLLADGTTTLELKSDKVAGKTGNLFVERYSSKAKQSPGGPWQSNSDIYVFWDVTNNYYYCFYTTELVQFLEEYIKEKKPKVKEVVNKGYITQGYAIPIKDLVGVMLEIQNVNDERNGAYLYG